MNPCQYGFQCPYGGMGADEDEYEIDLICTYPTPFKDCEDGKIYHWAYDTVCELCEPDCDLWKILDIYESEMTTEINQAIRRRREEFDKMWDEFKAKKEGRK